MYVEDDVKPHEKIYRLIVEKIEYKKSEGWVYHQCKQNDLLNHYHKLQEKGIFSLLEFQKQNYKEPKLTIELVPQTCWFSNVRSNVTTTEWNRLKKMTATAARYKCEICGGFGDKWPVECHEIWHYDDDKFKQTLQGLIALCPDCHSVKHMGFANIKGRSVEMTCHLAIINQWSYNYACDYVSEQFSIWDKRSSYDWKLDINWLLQYNIKPKKHDR